VKIIPKYRASVFLNYRQYNARYILFEIEKWRYSRYVCLEIHRSPFMEAILPRASSHLYVIAECSPALAVLAMIFNRTFGPIRYHPAIVSDRHASKELLAVEERTRIIAAQG